MVTWGERPYPGLCPSAVVELVKVDIDFLKKSICMMRYASALKLLFYMALLVFSF